MLVLLTVGETAPRYRLGRSGSDGCMVGRYEILRPLEYGSEITLFLAADRWKRRRRTLVLVRKGCPVDELEDRMEARIGLRHPLLRSVDGIAFRGGRAGAVVEPAGHPPLDLRRVSNSLPHSLELALDVISLARYIHARGLTLGWITPAMLRGDGPSLKKLDFPLPGEIRPALPVDSADCRYLAPETLQHGWIDEDADCYSIGMLLYQLFTAVEPYSDSDPEAIKEIQGTVHPIPPRVLRADLPEAVEQAVLGLIRKEPSRRRRLEDACRLLHPLLPGWRPRSPDFDAPLVGQDELLDRFRIQLRQPIDRSALVLFEGSPGVGISHLLRRIQLTAEAAGCTVIDVKHSPNEHRFGPFTRLLTPRNSPAQTFQGSEKSQILDRIESLTSSSSLIVRVDNLQWSSPKAIEIYKSLLESNRPVQVFAEYRDELADSPCRRLLIREARLDRLQRIQVEIPSPMVVRSLCRNYLAPSIDSDDVNELTELSGGYASHLKSLLEEEHRRGALVFTCAGWKIVNHGDLPRRVLPDSVSENVLQRTASLRPAELEILEYLAVLRKPVPLTRLSRLCNRSADSVETALLHLRNKGLIHEEGGLGGRFQVLTHPLVGEALLTRLPSNRLKYKHREVLTKWGSGSLSGEECEILVHHAIAAGDRQALSRFILPAIDYLIADGRYRRGSKMIEKAVSSDLLRRDSWMVQQRRIVLALKSGRLGLCRRLIDAVHAEKLPELQRAQLLLLSYRLHTTLGENTEAALAARDVLRIPDLRLTTRELAAACLCSSLSRAGIEAPARRAAAKVLKVLQIDSSIRPRDRLFHSLYLYSRQRDSLFSGTALRWEARSIRSAGNLARVTPHRFCNLARQAVVMGHWRRGERLAEFTEQLAQSTESPKLKVWCLIVRAMAQRKQGSHQRALQLLSKGYTQARIDCCGARIEFELHLERVRNACHQLDLEEASRALSRAQGLLGSHRLDIRSAEPGLLRGWIQLLSGEPEKALRTAADSAGQCGLRDPRPFLLAAQAELSLGHPEGVLKACARALYRLPTEATAYRAKVRLLQAEAELGRGAIRTALAYAKGAWLAAGICYNRPEMAHARWIQARCLMEIGERSRARGYGLRSLQLARGIERPKLRSGILETMSRLALEEGRFDEAALYCRDGLEPLSEIELRIAPPLREGFRKRHLAGLRELRRSSRPVVHSIRWLRHLTGRLSQSPDVDGAMRALCAVLTDELPTAGAAVYQIRSGQIEPLVMTGTLRFAFSSESAAEVPARGFRTFMVGRTTILLMSLRHLPGTQLKLQLEQVGRLNEHEMDVISTAGEIVSLYLNYRLLHPALDRRSVPEPVRILADGRCYVGEHAKSQAVVEEVQRFARSEATVLIYGESGTGKELIARMVHESSLRQSGPFVPVNCSALPTDLVESELFGYVAGSFTGATGTRGGLFEAAVGGTLFLDEIASMPLAVQPRLLRALQERRVRRLGDAVERDVDVRVIAASNQDLRELCRRGAFREDLFHRLNVLRIDLPPLRDRPSDIPALCDHFLDQLAQRSGIRRRMTRSAIEELSTYSFPGNVRELENLVERLALNSDTPDIGPSMVRAWIQDALPTSPQGSADRSSPRVDRIFERLTSGEADFWAAVREPYIRRDLCRDDVRSIVVRGLRETRGSYRQLLRLFGLPAGDYKRFLGFLATHDCKVDYRTYRRR